MQRRDFLTAGVTAGALPEAVPPGQTSASRTDPALPRGVTATAYANRRSNYSPFTTPDYYTWADDLVIERNRPGKPP